MTAKKRKRGGNMNTKKIKTEAELRLYLTRKWWDCLVIDEIIELKETIEINRPVKLVCSDAGKIYNGIHTQDIEDGVMFKVNTNWFEMERVFSTSELNNPSTFIKLQQCHNAIITNSNIVGFGYASIWAFDSSETIVADCTILGSGSTSHNYAIWQGGKGDAENQILTMQSCSVSKVRHAIGAHYGKNSYYAIGNTISTLKHSFDRHNSNDGTKRGGMQHVISGNTFLDPDRLAFSIATPYEGGSLVFTGNTLNHSKERHIGEVESVVGNYLVWEDHRQERFMIHGNKFTEG
jgi:hypothetical protein